MTDGRLRRIEDLYHAALARPAPERAAFLDSACGEDRALRDDVSSLLAHAASAADFLEQSPLAGATPAIAPALAEGSQLGPYEILAPIGAGGMGEVYRARDIGVPSEARTAAAAITLEGSGRHRHRLGRRSLRGCPAALARR